MRFHSVSQQAASVHARPAESNPLRRTRRQITLELDAAAREHLVRVGHDPAYGARPLKRIIQRELETALGRQLLEGKVRDGQAVEVGYDDKAKALTFEV